MQSSVADALWCVRHSDEAPGVGFRRESVTILVAGNERYSTRPPTPIGWVVGSFVGLTFVGLTFVGLTFVGLTNVCVRSVVSKRNK
jgi:hypothetical protein